MTMAATNLPARRISDEMIHATNPATHIHLRSNTLLVTCTSARAQVTRTHRPSRCPLSLGRCTGWMTAATFQCSASTTLKRRQRIKIRISVFTMTRNLVSHSTRPRTTIRTREMLSLNHKRRRHSHTGTYSSPLCGMSKRKSMLIHPRQILLRAHRR